MLDYFVRSDLSEWVLPKPYRGKPFPGPDLIYVLEGLLAQGRLYYG